MVDIASSRIDNFIDKIEILNSKTEMGSTPSTNSSQFKQHKPLKLKNLNEQTHNKYRQYIHDQLLVDDKDRLCIREIMNKHCLFCHLSPQLIENAIDKVIKWKYSGGCYIYRQHDIANSLYLIKDGGVYVEIDCSIVKTLRHNEYFGHDSVCFSCPRSQSIRVASQQIVLYELKKESILGLIKKEMEAHRQTIFSLFNRIHFFNYLTNRQKQSIIENTYLFRLKFKESIFEKQQGANSFFIVGKGEITIQISCKKNVMMTEGDYFGQSAFSTQGNNKRKGRAFASIEQTQLYAIGLTQFKQKFGEEMRSIVFFNKQKWTLYRDPILNELKDIDYSYLLQLFNVREGSKFSILSKKKSIPKYLFIPLDVQINMNKDAKLYCSEYLLQENKDNPLSEDIILTEGGYYAYALIEEFKEVISLQKVSHSQKDINVKALKQPICKVLTLSIRNISKYSKKIPSSQYSTVLIVQDMKFGGEFILKIYKKKIRNRQMTVVNSLVQVIQPIKCSKLKTVKIVNQESLTSLNGIISQKIIEKDLDNQLTKIQVDDQLVIRQKEIMQSLNSPFVCGFYKGQQDSNHYYLFIEHIVGLTLDEIMLDFGKVPQSIIKYFLASIATALDYLHSQRIIYRNLNPSNIIIKHSGHLVLTDFSCSKRLQNGRTNSLVGVPYYMAPEVIQQRSYSFNADIWSMGVVLYEMMSGSLPFGQNASDVLSIYQSILHDELNLNKITNKDGKLLLKSLFERDADRRMKSALQLRNFGFMTDVEFDWPSFLQKKMNPFYFPIKKCFNYTNFNNYNLFDASTVQELQ